MRRLQQLFLLLLLVMVATSRSGGYGSPSPGLWPERFHALLYMNLTTTGKLLVTELWYDWPRGRNMNRMQQQLDDLLWDVEWDNGTSYYYTLGPVTRSCITRRFPVGIPRRDWMVGSTYLGMEHTDGFLCHVWTKLDFIWYYEDVDTRRPVRWDFFDGITNHVMTFEVGAVLDDSEWQAPSYCFEDGQDGDGDGEQQGKREDLRRMEANRFSNILDLRKIHLSF